MLCLIRQWRLQKCWTPENKWDEHAISLCFLSPAQGVMLHMIWDSLVLGFLFFCTYPNLFWTFLVSCIITSFFFFWPLRTDQHTHLGEASVNGPVWYVMSATLAEESELISRCLSVSWGFHRDPVEASHCCTNFARDQDQQHLYSRF